VRKKFYQLDQNDWFISGARFMAWLLKLISILLYLFLTTNN